MAFVSVVHLNFRHNESLTLELRKTPQRAQKSIELRINIISMVPIGLDVHHSFACFDFNEHNKTAMPRVK